MANQKFMLTDRFVAELERTGKKYERRDLRLPGFLVRVEASGKKTYYYRYSINREVKWFRIGPAEMGAAAARLMTRRLIGAVALGGDPQAERKAKRGGLTFEQLHQRYVTERAQKRNKSWRQASYLVTRFVLPRWARLPAAGITRADVKALLGSMSSPTTANQVKFAVSAVLKHGVREGLIALNPARDIDDNPVTSRSRVLSASELPLFWRALDRINPAKAAALKVVLLTGARPGEVCHMRWEHLKDGWWEQPGEPQPGWPGTKNKCFHRLWLPASVREIIGTHVAHSAVGHVFLTERGSAFGELHGAMREISRLCEFNPPVTAHDLRRTHGTTITGRGHGREAMDRMLNHREKKSTTNTYDCFEYAEKDRPIWEDVAAAILAIAEGNVVDFHRVEQR